MRHKSTAQDTDANAFERRQFLQRINEKNVEFQDFTGSSTASKKRLRDEMAEMED